MRTRKERKASCMTKQTKPFIFCVHAHQPVGNFEHILEEAFNKCYKPFVEVLSRHPQCPVVMHLSGSLLDWLKLQEPAFLKALKRLQDQGQLEILGGAYYEPVFSEIPVRNLEGQIQRMQKDHKEVFGRMPKGLWLTERVWRPELLPVLAAAGVEYTVLDDCHFERAGHLATSGYCRLTEDKNSLDLFASSKNLRYLIPFSQVEDAVSAIRTTANVHQGVAVFADDCEKFGLWPKTSAWVYGQQWLDKFFTAIEKNTDIKMMTFETARTQLKPQEVPHVPAGSYEEMSDWAGGTFDQFSDKYAESRYMKERAWATSLELSKWESNPNGNALQVREAQTSLYKAQCNCSYWHGVFGGLYMHHLRSATFENLIQADEVLFDLEQAHVSDKAEDFHKVSYPSGDRWKRRQESLISFWNPGLGGALEELDYLPKSVNLMCTLRRSPEPYHEVVTKNGHSRLTSGFSIHQLLGVKERGLEKALIYDPYRRLSFMDHFFNKPLSVKEFEGVDYVEMGDFVSGAFQAESQGGHVLFSRMGVVSGSKVMVSKTLGSLEGNVIRVQYNIQNKGAELLRVVWGVEFNFSIGNEEGPRVWEKDAVNNIRLVDSWRQIPIQLSSRGLFRVLCCPVETVSGSESGLGRTYQGLSLLWQREIALASGESLQEEFDLQVGDFL